MSSVYLNSKIYWWGKYSVIYTKTLSLLFSALNKTTDLKKLTPKNIKAANYPAVF